MTGSSCGSAARPIAMVFADAPSDEYVDVVEKTCRYAVGIWAVSVAEVDYVNEPSDFVASEPRGPGDWLDVELPCRDDTCWCTGQTTQNSYRAMLDRFGAACGD